MPKYQVKITKRIEETAMMKIEAADEDAAWEAVNRLCQAATVGDESPMSELEWELELTAFEAEEVEDDAG